MNKQELLAEQFEANRSHLRGVAYRMLGSLSEADDAVQESWFRLSRTDTAEIENLKAWLTTVVARVCLDLLRSRKSRREESLEAEVAAAVTSGEDPEHEAVLADSVGLALLVVLDMLTPAERLAFVLHDMFGVSFDEIAVIVDRSPMATRQLASRARRRVQGTSSLPEADLKEQREVVNAFLSALRAGDFEGLVAVLDPDVVVHTDGVAGRRGTPRVIRGATNWAKGAIAFSRLARFVQPALVNGSVGLILAPNGQLQSALSFKIVNGKVVAAEVVTDRDRLSQFELGVIE